MEALGLPLESLSREITLLTSNVNNLKEVDRQLAEWNLRFGKMVNALAMVKGAAGKQVEAVSKFEQVLEEKCGTEEKQEAPEAETTNKNGQRKRTLVESKPAQKLVRKKKRIDPWEKAIENVAHKMPKKYQCNKDDMNRLKVVWRTVRKIPVSCFAVPLLYPCKFTNMIKNRMGLFYPTSSRYVDVLSYRPTNAYHAS
mmetsp:Transcript_28253/g.45512  ORF Transcript_28253/g.45512 Transcript_28253/m.45512 type:complete len:198 (-) Transcript_28253:4094-4687(-)